MPIHLRLLLNMSQLDQDLKHLRRSFALALEAKARGDEPFGAVLVDDQGHVLVEALNSVNTVLSLTSKI